MSKIFKLLKLSLLIIYIIIILILILNNEKFIILLNLPNWIIPSIFYVSFIYICYRYIKLKYEEDRLENEIISIINHTFRTPLTSIDWYLNELEKSLPQNEKLQYLQNISNSTNKILNTIDVLIGIKNIKNTSSYYFEAISIREIIESSIKKYRDNINKKNIIFEISSFKEIPLLTVDLKKISFVIDSIIENSIFYTKNKGKILIDCIPQSNKLTFFVSDTGIGLSFIDKIMIFSKFYRNKRAKLLNTDGMGLKLYLSREIIKRHKGKIYAKSNGQDEGTTFFIEIPYIK